MVSRYLDVFVLSNAHYYDDTPLLTALGCNQAVRQVFKERYSSNPAQWTNTIFLDPSVYPFDRVIEVTDYIRHQNPHLVFVLCSTEATIRDFMTATNNRFEHCFQFDYTKVISAPDPLVDEAVKASQIEIDRHLRSLYQYDVVLSFAGEEREYAQAIGDKLRVNGLVVFDEDLDKGNLRAPDLASHLYQINQQSQYYILLASKAYADKMSYEDQAAREWIISKKVEQYILPIRCDDTQLPGLPENIKYFGIQKDVDVVCDHLLRWMGVIRSEL
jgi:hypothetical protein